jgi:predicted ATP-grasp superfamily ATP-dependent carboligase
LPHDVLILGTSCRAAAISALRCGLRARCADYFADRDLAAVCTVLRVEPRHAGRQFVALADALPPAPWFYTGGFENHPEWVERISRRHQLWGVDAETLRAVRNPRQVAAILRRSAIPCPEMRRSAHGLPRDGTWLVKPLRSGGGRGIEPLTVENTGERRPCYFQQRIGGPSFSALFIGENAGACLIGVTRQLIGIAGSPFAYRGSIGPIPLTENLSSKLRHLGDTLTAALALRGWFGVDYILHDGDPWPVEINPRYTASLEIHELAGPRALLAEHRRACLGSAAPGEGQARRELPRSPVIAKLILYAPWPIVVPEIAAPEYESDDLFAIRSIADIPRPGSRFEPGEPVMTLLAGGENLAACQSRMTELEGKWMHRLGISIPAAPSEP